MDRRLSEFVRENKNNDRDIFYTHVSCIRPKGRYGFGRDEQESFWELYSNMLHENDELISGMAEIPQEYSMLVVDGDIKKKCEDVLVTNPNIYTQYLDGDTIKYKYVPIKLYTEDHIKNTIAAYQEVIKNVTKDWNPKHSVCVLLEKKPYISDEYMKSGFHLAFINYFCSKTLEDTYLIPRVVDKVNQLEIFKDIGYSQSSTVLDISKKHSNPKPWLLYGSRKSETSGKYYVSKIYDENCEEISLYRAFSTYKLFNSHQTPFDIDMDNISYYYPRIFSINPTFRETVDIIPVFDSTANITFGNGPSADKDDMKYDQTMDQQLQTARELIELLDPERAEKRDEWLEIGWVLYSISNGSEEGLEIWIDFSKQSDKFTFEVCLKEWSRMFKGNFTIGSLKHYAKIDSPVEYEQFWKSRLEKMVTKAVSGSHNDLAKALYESYSTDYVCASLKPEIWFRYINHHWEQMEEGIELRRKISDDLVYRYSTLIKDQFDNLADVEDDEPDVKKQIEGKVANIYKLIKNLKSNTFKNAVMKECKEVFYDSKFLKRLGKNKYLLALQNGVYDCQNHVFREGKPEDYICLQMPISYREFNEADPWVIETSNFFDKVFPDTGVREYFMDRCAELLVGGNKRKHAYFWTGKGNNGKSIMKLMIQKMFGDYFIDLPNSILVGKKTAQGQACPELARSDRGVRVACTQEPNKTDVMNGGAIKEFTGNDSFYTRTLFDKGGEIEPMFKLIIIANDLPRLNGTDPALLARLKVEPFEAQFVDNPPVDEDEQFRTMKFLKDETFDEKVEHMLEPLFWLLANRLKHIKKVIFEPLKIKRATELYIKSQDMFIQFIEEKIIECDKKYRITINEFYIVFSMWFKTSFPGQRVPTRNDCMDYLEDRWGNSVNYAWPGFKISTPDDDVAKGIAQEHASVDEDYIQVSGNPLCGI